MNRFLLFLLLVFVGSSCEDTTDSKSIVTPLTQVKQIKPHKGFTTVETSVEFQWKAAQSLDNQTINYDFYLSSDGKFSAPLKSDLKDTELQLSNLKDNESYSWFVVAKDQSGNITSSDTLIFFVNNDSPSSPVTVFPSFKEKDLEKTLQFRWNKSVDKNDELSYKLYVATEAVYGRNSSKLTPGDVKTPTNFKDTSFTVDILAHTRYYWKVDVTDGVNTLESQVLYFDTKNYKPTKPVATLKTEYTSKGINANISWAASTNKDNDPIEYIVSYSKSKDFSDPIEIRTKDLTYSFKNLLFDDFYVKVEANDVIGGEFFSQVSSDTIKYAVQNSELSDFNSIANAIEKDAASDKIRWKPMGDIISYTVFVSEDDKFEENEIIVKNSFLAKAKLKNTDSGKSYNVKVVGVSKSGKKELNGTITTGRFGSMVDVRDGKIYKTVSINGKIWLAENFAYLPYFRDPVHDEYQASVYGVKITGTPGESFTPPTIADAKAHLNYTKYGVMYSAYFCDSSATLAPQGWHVASDEEWKELEAYAGIASEDLNNSGYRGSVVAKFLADVSWLNPVVSPTDELGLGILPAGYNKTLEDAGEGNYVYYWTSSYYINSKETKSYYNRALKAANAGVNRGSTKASAYRMYVRLVKDYK